MKNNIPYSGPHGLSQHNDARLSHYQTVNATFLRTPLYAEALQAARVRARVSGGTIKGNFNQYIQDWLNEAEKQCHANTKMAM